jgi:hypothetical protein
VRNAPRTFPTRGAWAPRKCSTQSSDGDGSDAFKTSVPNGTRYTTDICGRAGIESGSSSLPRIAPGPALAAERCGMVFHVSAPTGSSEEIRRRVEGWRAAERREREVREAEGAPPVSVALEAGLELCQLDPHPPGTVDPVRAREDESARRAWDRLRRGLGWQPSATARP